MAATPSAGHPGPAPFARSIKTNGALATPARKRERENFAYASSYSVGTSRRGATAFKSLGAAIQEGGIRRLAGLWLDPQLGGIQKCRPQVRLLAGGPQGLHHRLTGPHPRQ